MSVIKDITRYVQEGNAGGLVLELADGSLIKAGESVAGTKSIKKSTDGGQTWVAKQNFPNSSMQARCNFIDQQGNIYIGTELTTTQALLYRSTDNGETWTLVLTAASSSLWHMCQASNGTLYLNEYSIGNQDASELYAYIIYRSTDNGATWSAWYTATQQSTPGAKDGIRHVHHISIDSKNRLYAGFGDLTFAGQATKAYEMNSNATLGTQISSADNGFTCMVEASDGSLIFGGDSSPFRLVRWNPDTNTLTVLCDIASVFGNRYATAILDMKKGKDGVIYAITNGSASKPSVILVSGDDGATWDMLLYNELKVNTAAFLTINMNRAGSRVYITRAQSGSQTYASIPDFTRRDILSKRTPIR